MLFLSSPKLALAHEDIRLLIANENVSLAGFIESLSCSIVLDSNLGSKTNMKWSRSVSSSFPTKVLGKRSNIFPVS